LFSEATRALSEIRPKAFIFENVRGLLRKSFSKYFGYIICRFLPVDDIWIPLGESLLIEKTKPLWNIVVDGFGNHDPGSGRYNQQISAWDTIHPGRQWALKLQKGKPEEEIIKQIVTFLNKKELL
jgi:hypothetical protein